jgi:uncharacterized protein (TIGR03083 family)
MSTDDRDLDLGAAYGAARRRIADLVGHIDAATEALTVPATPEWTVHDVVAHLVGVAADGTSGNMDGAPGEAWTAAQVQRGKNVPLGDSLADWERTGPLIEAFLSAGEGEMAGAAVIDVHTHEADLRHALGLPVAVPDDVLRWTAAFMRRGFHEAITQAGLPAVTVEASDLEWFRGRLGRRTEAEVAAYRWVGGDGAPVPAGANLDHWFVFGRAAAPLGETQSDVS